MDPVHVTASILSNQTVHPDSGCASESVIPSPVCFESFPSVIQSSLSSRSAQSPAVIPCSSRVVHSGDSFFLDSAVSRARGVRGRVSVSARPSTCVLVASRASGLRLWRTRVGRCLLRSLPHPRALVHYLQSVLVSAVRAVDPVLLVPFTAASSRTTSL
jgi:hypothetical protein